MEDSDGSFIKEHSHSQKSASTVSGVPIQRAPVNFDIDDEDGGDPLGGGGAPLSDASSTAGPRVVPHSGAGKGKVLPPPPMKIRPISLREVNRDNFFKNYGIQLTDADEIDLDHTSCETSEDEAEQPQNRRKLSHNNVPSSQFEDDEEDSFNTLDRESADRSAEAHQQQAEASDSDFSLTRLRSLSISGVPKDQEKLDNEDDESSSSSSSSSSEVGSLVKGGKSASSSKPAAASMSLVVREKSGSERSSGSTKSMGGHASKSRVKDCFLCSWGNRQHDMVNNEDMKKLLGLIHNNIGEVGLEFLALIVHRFYKNQIQRVAAARGQYLPKWRSRDILICLETHNHNPKIKLSSTLRNISVVQNALENRLFIESVDEKGEKRVIPDVEVFKLYEKIVKLDFSVRKIDIKQMNFYRPGDDATHVEGSHWKGVAIKRPRPDMRFIGRKK